MPTPPASTVPAPSSPPVGVEAALARLAGAVVGEIVLSEVTILTHGTGVRVRLERPLARVEAPPAALALPVNWRDHASLEADLEAAAPLAVELVAVLPRGRLGTGLRLAAGERATLRLDLADLPLAAGTGPLYEPTAVRLNLRALSGGGTVLVLHGLRLRPAAAPRGAVVDTLGQRRNGAWPGKARDVRELRVRADEEARELAGRPPPGGSLDRYGGWLGGGRFAATGYFRVERDPTGRWWFVTPEGNPYWALGTTGVRLGSANDTTRARGREQLFEALPAPGEEGWFSGRHSTPAGELEIEGNVHLYRWNVFRKYGSAEAWRDRVLDRWRSWGLNCFGAWADELMCAQERVPYTRFLRTRGLPDAGAAAGAFPDVWDPRWSEAVDAAFARDTAAGRGQSWLLGYFVDNEAPWRDMRLLDIAPDAPLREAWLALARSRHETVADFNRAQGTRCADWEAVRRLRTSEMAPGGSLLADLEARYAEQYFATVARHLRRHAPDHLYLGCRFVRLPPADGIIAAAGRHVDVLSVNCYARSPDPQAFSEWHRVSGGRPILIGEFHFPLASPRQLPPLWEAFPETEREGMFTTFVEGWARQPWSVGCHWYQHADQPVLGRHVDGENQTVGFVDLTDTPYDHLVRAARVAASGMYAWHAAPRAGC